MTTVFGLDMLLLYNSILNSCQPFYCVSDPAVTFLLFQLVVNVSEVAVAPAEVSVIVILVVL